MASIRDAARNVLDVARGANGWIALWKVGRSWNTMVFWPMHNVETNKLTFDPYDDSFISDILLDDPNAIIVHSWIHDLGPVSGATCETLAYALRRQYNLQHARIADFIARG